MKQPVIYNLDGLVLVLVNWVSDIAPILAPLPTAWLVYDRTMRHLGWPWPVAAMAGLTLELLGVGILATWLMLYGYNLSKRKTDPVAVMWLPAILVVVYFLTAEALTVALDVWPVAAIVAPALFPVLSVAAFALLALRADHRQRLVDIADSKAEARMQRELRQEMRRAQLSAQSLMQSDDMPTKSQIVDTSVQRVQAVDTSVQVPTFRYATDHARWLHEQQPELTQAEVAERVGCAPSTVCRAWSKNGDNQ